MLLSITGTIRTILLIIGGMVVLRFIGQLMIAKRNLEAERQAIKRQKTFEKERANKLKNFGKTELRPKGARTDNVQDVDYEEVN